jgi:hypothetical protein
MGFSIRVKVGSTIVVGYEIYETRATTDAIAAELNSLAYKHGLERGMLADSVLVPDADWTESDEIRSQRIIVRLKELTESVDTLIAYHLFSMRVLLETKKAAPYRTMYKGLLEHECHMAIKFPWSYELEL